MFWGRKGMSKKGYYIGGSTIIRAYPPRSRRRKRFRGILDLTLEHYAKNGLDQTATIVVRKSEIPHDEQGISEGNTLISRRKELRKRSPKQNNPTRHDTALSK
jgi:hypothetical protein